MKKLILAVASLGVVAAPAVAADMRVKAPILKAPPPPAFSWTGCYIGGNIGGKAAFPSGSVTIPGVAGLATSVFSFDDSSSSDSTFIGGGQVGCNYQTGQYVFGIEGDYDWQDWSDTAVVGTPFPPNFVPGDRFSMNSKWEASLRGRLGYAFDRALIYATGGVAWTNVSLTSVWVPALCGGVPCPGVVAADSHTLTGATLGGGLEYAFTDYLSAGIEGRYTWYQSENFNSGIIPIAPVIGAAVTFISSPTTANLKLNTAEIMGKLNWRLGWFNH